MKNLRTVLWVGLFIISVLFWQCHRKTVPAKSKANAQSESKSSKPLKSEDFDTFYQKFHSDSLFQVSRVQFPLKGQQIHLKGTSSWKKEKWLMIKAKASELDRSVYNIKTLKKTDYYFEGIYCKNCIFTFEMEFRLLNGKWYLTYLKEKDE